MPSFLNQSLTVININLTVGKVAGAVGGISLLGILWKAVTSAWFWKLLAGVNVFANRKYAELSCRKILKQIQKDPGIVGLSSNSRKVKFEFIRELRVEDLEDGECVLITLDSHKNTPRNVTATAVQYISKNLFPKSSATLKEEIEKGVAYTLTKHILESNRLTAAEKYFDCNLLPAEFKKFPSLSQIMEDMRQIDSMGLLTRVLVQQYYDLNRKRLDTFLYSEVQQETEDFYKFLFNIANRAEFEHTTELKFFRKHIKVRVMLITSSRKARDGAQDLLKRINNQTKADHIYLICPAINRNMIERTHVPAWRLYRDVLSLIELGNSNFHLTATPQIFHVPGARGAEIKVSVAFLERR